MSKIFKDGFGELLHIDELIKVCGHFTTDTELNSGYGCTHKENTEAQGCCFAFACPVAIRADLSIIKIRDANLYEQYKNDLREYLKNGQNEEDVYPGFIGEDYMVIFPNETKLIN